MDSAMGPANITANINFISMLNGSSFKSWKENLEIVLRVMNLDLALKEDSPPALTDKSTSVEKREKEKVCKIEPYVRNDYEEEHLRSTQRHNV
ncbi:UNVERIFIED_CONTAM: hypothetical protein Sradi_3865000 [Sesamum radiatum]|uniref:Retrotransposon Copia-like N-terminal domain-containing protein n=1 Tax=Sesamum radiatum TaxID=300843 RepID=A0AAW2Q1S6_SESRA